MFCWSVSHFVSSPSTRVERKCIFTFSRQEKFHESTVFWKIFAKFRFHEMHQNILNSAKITYSTSKSFSNLEIFCKYNYNLCRNSKFCMVAAHICSCLVHFYAKTCQNLMSSKYFLKNGPFVHILPTHLLMSTKIGLIFEYLSQQFSSKCENDFRENAKT